MRLAINNGTGWLKTLVACSFSGPPGVGLPGVPPPLPAPATPYHKGDFSKFAPTQGHCIESPRSRDFTGLINAGRVFSSGTQEMG